MAKPKRAYCEYAGGFVPLSRGRSGKPIAQAPQGEWVACAEGVENGLSVALARPELRVLTSVSLANLGNITLPDHIGGVYVIADNDSEPDALRQLNASLALLETRNFPTRVVRAPEPHKDFNDWLQVLAAQSGKERQFAHV
nr:toprim domain-containing protein [Chelatococcus asaccharovorans]